MKFLLAAVLGLMSLGAHNLDEYRQAALLGVERERVEISVRMSPGLAVFGAFSALIDGDGDGRISTGEEDDYRIRASRDWRLYLDETPLRMSCASGEISPLSELRDGAGAVSIRCVADFDGMPAGAHRLRFRNEHQVGWSVYMMNALQPGPGVTIQAQRRDPRQREITIEFEAIGPVRRSASWWLGALVAPLLLRGAYLARAERARVSSD